LGLDYPRFMVYLGLTVPRRLDLHKVLHMDRLLLEYLLHDVFDMYDQRRDLDAQQC
jgi:hypothetical protein